MNTKIVYVVTSTDKDNYLYQTLLSIYSLRQHNPEAIVELVVDAETDRTIKGNRALILDYVDKKIVVEVPDKYNKVQTSRYMKTSLRKYVEGDYLFVDSDTVITDRLDGIDNFEDDLGAVPDTHTPLSQYEPRNQKLVMDRINKAGWNGSFEFTYYNSGIMFVRDCQTSREFYKRWHERWRTTLEKARLHYDQPSLYAINAEMGGVVKELAAEWNCQVMNNGLTCLYKARIIHYMANHAISRRHADKAYRFHDKAIYEDIEETGKISAQTADLVTNAKGAFVTPCVVIVGNELELMRNGLYKLRMSLPGVYRAFDIIGGGIHTLGWSIIKFYRKHVKGNTY